MSRAVKYMDVLGNVRWQPRRIDRYRYCTGYVLEDWFHETSTVGNPVLYRWKWRAELRAKISELIDPPSGRWKETK